jgi:hypothetical protein
VGIGAAFSGLALGFVALSILALAFAALGGRPRPA